MRILPFRKPLNPKPHAARNIWLEAAAPLGLAIALAAGAGLAPKTARAEAPVSAVSGRASVIDADTLDIHGQRVRLNAIDAPESGQKCRDPSGRLFRCGAMAANALDQFIAGNPVACKGDSRDRYHRLVANCTVRGQDIQLWLVESGYAFAFRRYSTAYVGAEAVARRNRAGLWAGAFVYPWDWRKGDRLPEERHSQPPPRHG